MIFILREKNKYTATTDPNQKSRSKHFLFQDFEFLVFSENNMFNYVYPLQRRVFR